MNSFSHLTVPSSMVFYTPLMDRLAEKNPSLAQEVVNALNRIDRDGRNYFFRQVIGDEKVHHG